jgi:hypothetical protein
MHRNILTHAEVARISPFAALTWLTFTGKNAKVELDSSLTEIQSICGASRSSKCTVIVKVRFLIFLFVLSIFGAQILFRITTAATAVEIVTVMT